MMYDLDDVTPANARDVLAAAPDGIALALGARLVKSDLHPFAMLTAESPLRFPAFAAGQILSPRRGDETQAAVIGRGLRTPGFSRALAAGIEVEARRKFDAQAQHLAAVATVEVTRLGEPEPVGALDLSVPFENVEDGLEYKASNGALRDGETIELSSLGRLIGVTREAVFNDSLHLIRDAIAAAGVAAARLEMRLVAAALETTGNLSSDGSPVFGAAHGNVSVSAGVLSSATFADAMAKLRTQLAADGEALNAAAAYLIVPPAAELVAWQIVASCRMPISVLVLTGVAANRFYLVSSSDVARSIAVARLSGATHPLAVEGVHTPLQYDGAIVRVRIDTGAAMLGRLGVVRAS